MPEALFKLRPIGRQILSPDGVGGSSGNDPLKKYEWTPLKDYSWCGDAMMNEDLMGRGYTLVNAYIAEQYKQAGKIAVQRGLTQEEQLLSQFEREERAFVVVDPQAAALCLIPYEFMQNPRVARQQKDEDWESLGIDTENRYIMVRTKILAEREREDRP